MSFGQSWQMLIKALKLSYEHMGKVMLMNIAWFVLGFLPFLAFTYLPLDHNVFFVASLVLSVITLGGAMAAIHYVMNLILDREEVTLRDFWKGFKRFVLRGSVLFLLAILGFVLLIFNIWFSANYPSTIFMILSGFWIWGILFWASLHQFVFPFVINQDIGIFLSIKRAALLTLDNPLVSIVLIVLNLIVIVLSALLAAPILIFTASFLAILQNCFYREMMLKYDTIDQVESEEDV